jgi:SAM-dependent methyltransferase
MKHWTQVNWQPNAPVVKDMRRRQLEGARRPPCDDRVARLLGLARGKRVLDVGVVDHVATAFRNPDWLHGKIVEAAESCVGVDVMKTGIHELQQAGYDVRYCDITRDVPDGGPFDLIVCGEVIEHLGNPAGLFENAREALSPGGRLVITTPNPYFVGRAIRHLFGRDEESVDHVTLLFPSGIAELASRAGLRLDTYCGVLSAPGTRRRQTMLRLLRAGTMVMTQDAVCSTLMYECVKPTDGPTT